MLGLTLKGVGSANIAGCRVLILKGVGGLILKRVGANIDGCMGLTLKGVGG